ncbi:MAG: hypothetical protein GX927_11045 [Lentisphaerae bacterium]|jgi:hypothetical protein|nr:hypothetical protein [Lentisphaerota bacterium]
MKNCTFLSALLLLFAASIRMPAEEILYDCPESWQANNNVQFQQGVFQARGILHFFAADPVKVETGKQYTLTAEIRNPLDVKLPGICLAAVVYDDQNRQIHSRHYLTMPNSETTLAAPVHMEDSSLLVEVNPQWKLHKHWALTVAFDIQPDASDLPNSKVSTKILSFEPEQEFLRVHVEKKLYAEFPVGTKVRLHHQGSFYLPCPDAKWYNFCGTDWKCIGGQLSVPAKASHFRPAIIYYDHSKPPKNFFELKNVKLTIKDKE